MFPILISSIIDSSQWLSKTRNTKWTKVYVRAVCYTHYTQFLQIRHEPILHHAVKWHGATPIPLPHRIGTYIFCTPVPISTGVTGGIAKSYKEMGTSCWRIGILSFFFLLKYICMHSLVVHFLTKAWAKRKKRVKKLEEIISFRLRIEHMPMSHLMSTDYQPQSTPKYHRKVHTVPVRKF